MQQRGRTGTGRKGGIAAAVLGTALAATAAAATGAAAQDTTRADSASRAAARQAVDAITARSAAFRDTVARALGDFDFEYGTPRSRRWADRLAGGFTLSVSQPTGQFRRFAGVGVGLAANAQVSADRGGVLGLRVEGGAQNYGRSASAVQQSYGAFYNRQYRQVTTNDIYWGSVGPQLTLPLGPVRPYAFGTVGVANFVTASRLVGLGLDGRESQSFSVTDLSNFATTRGYGGGVRFVVPRGPGRVPLAVDLGARAHLIRAARYLVPGAFAPDQDPALQSIRGQANFVTYHIGVSAGGR